jgi:CDP-glucose 4,6-dehydratase
MLKFYHSKRVLVTGHTGFKGSWLCLWLNQLGAEVAGYALAPEKTPDSLYDLSGISTRVRSQLGDIRNYETLHHFMQSFRPDIVFHMAAQSLVLPSYESPLETFSTNIMGTATLLEAVRKTGGVKAVVNVTTDKCYENNETGMPFREGDPLGGYDPYSSSKAAAEIVSAGYRRSFFTKDNIPMATVRAGNVIGGGDFSRYRLIPDIIRAAKTGASVNLRQPGSIRPWQHVFDVLRGYLMLAQALCEKGEDFAQAFNFGPDDSNVTVGEVADKLAASMKHPPVITRDKSAAAHEAQTLNLDNSKAKSLLGWRPLFTTQQAIENTAQWYEQYMASPQTIAQFSTQQLTLFMASS